MLDAWLEPPDEDDLCSDAEELGYDPYDYDPNDDIDPDWLLAQELDAYENKIYA